ncbi:MAG: hypothetical protein WAW39_13600 [Prosthecobacter sp.]|uniref:hypothetical protein n=1 Tax=Prosthecobacter sp. TaxID=1965333 RepID=UPI003BAE78CC
MHRTCSLLLLLTFLTLAQGKDPAKDKAPAQDTAPAPPPVDLDAKARLRQKMNEIIIPTVHFENATLEQALEFLRKKSRELDKSSAPAGARGVNIILSQTGFQDSPHINLDLKDVPLSEVLRYVTELSLRRFRVESQAVIVTGLHDFEDAMQTRTYHVVPDFLSTGNTSSTAPADPFATVSPSPPAAQDAPPPQFKTARQILESAGITFPEGASAIFNPLTSQLTVKNTLPNLDLIEAYTVSGHLAPALVAYTITVIEGPGELIREANAQASQNANAAPALASLLDHSKNPDSKVRVVADAFLETKSGTRAVLEAVCEHSESTNFTLDAKSRASVSNETHQSGLHLEIEPIVGADGATIETSLSLVLNAAPPTQRQISVNDPLTGNPAEFPVTDIPGTHIATGLSIHAGTTKLIGVTKPIGTPQESTDILCAVFLTASLRRVEAVPPSQPKVAPPSAIPPGMTFAALHAPEGMFEPVLHGTKHLTLQARMAQSGVTFPSGSILEHRDGILRCVNTPDNIAFIMAIIDQQLSVYPKTIALTLHTLEAPAPFLRDLTRQTLASADDSAIFAAVESAVARGEAKFINSTFVESKSGTRVNHHAACEHRYLKGIVTDAQGRPSLSFATRQVGSIFEVEPTIGADSRTVELIFSHELHPTPPILRRDHFRDPASQQPFDIPATDFNIHKIVTGISIAKGSTKLISINKPMGLGKTNLLWVTFLKCDVVPQVPKTHHAMAEPAPDPKPSADPKAIHTRSFRVPPDFLSAGGGSTSTDGRIERKTARIILEEAGIPFPEGTAAYYDPPTTQMVVKNTNENLDLIQTYVDSIVVCPPAIIAFTTHILQGPGPLLRRLTAQSTGRCDHRAELNELLAAVKAGTMQHLNSSRIETKSGTSATTTQATKHIAIADVSVNEKGEPHFTQEKREVGLKIELEPTIGADGHTIELTFAPEFHTAPHFEHREHLIDTQGRRLEFPLTDYFTSKLTTGITLPDGSARLLSLYKPTGKPEFEKDDILQAIFITCDILRPEK